MSHVDQQSICSWCVEAGLTSFFSLPIATSPYQLSKPYLNRKREPLQRTLEDLLADPTCSLCRLLVEALSHAEALPGFVSSNTGDTGISYRLQYGLPANESPTDTDRYLSSNPDWDGVAADLPRLVLSVTGQDVKVRLQRLRHPTDTVDDPPFCGRIIEPQANIELIKLWLSECETSHECQSEPGLSTLSEWIIDVEEACLVRYDAAVQESRFAALSYVWGPPGTPQLENLEAVRERLATRGGLSADHRDVPHTIRDAMTLCSHLGIRYLWVDALCIEQEAGYLPAGLLSMRSVYGKAYVTIVCVNGTDSWYGLPGVGESRPRRHIKSTLMVDGTMLGVAASPALKIHQGVWSSRGWTYQEEVLSWRVLYFTDDEVLFGCDSGILWREGMELEPRCVQPLTQRLGDNHTLTSHGPQKLILSKKVAAKDSFEHRNYMEHLQKYCDRNLTNDEDALKAFEGIMAVYAVRLNTHHFEGHPIEYFTNLMHFTSERPIPRDSKELFPSWSWCYWKGPLTVHPYRKKRIDWVTWYRAQPGATPEPETTETHDTHPVQLVDLTHSGSTPHCVHELLCFEDPTRRALFVQDPLDLAEQLNRIYLRLPTAASKYLKYTIVGEMEYHHIAIGRESIPDENGKPSTHFPITDARFKRYPPMWQPETISLQADWRMKQPSHLEFVYLSHERAHFDFRRDGSNIYVNAILIETDGNGLSRRVQLGQFNRLLWRWAYNGPPRTRWVCLR